MEKSLKIKEFRYAGSGGGDGCQDYKLFYEIISEEGKKDKISTVRLTGTFIGGEKKSNIKQFLIDYTVNLIIHSLQKDRESDCDLIVINSSTPIYKDVSHHEVKVGDVIPISAS